MYEVTVSSWFAAAHRLKLSNGRWEPLHGHNWRVSATLSGSRLDSMGVLVDFTWLKPVLERIVSRWHDRNLNDSQDFAHCNPSAENVARCVAELLAGELPGSIAVSMVEIEEAPGCVARFCAGAGRSTAPKSPSGPSKRAKPRRTT